MEIDVLSNQKDSTSDQITVVYTKRKNHENIMEKNVPVCGINKYVNDKKAGESCMVDENILNPIEVENSEEINQESKEKKHDSVCGNNSCDDANKYGENCIENETNSNSIEAKCSGGIQCEIKKNRPGKRDRAYLRLNRQHKSSSGDGIKVNRVSAPENGTNLLGGSSVNTGPDLVGCAAANSCTKLQGTERNDRNKGELHSCSDTDNVDISNNISTLEIACSSNSKTCSSKKLDGTVAVPVSENSADLGGGAVADDSNDLPVGGKSNTDLQCYKRKRKNKSEKRNSSESNIYECEASSNNCSSKETIVTEKSVVTKHGTHLMQMKKKSKKADVNREVIYEEGSEKKKQTSLPSSPIRVVTDNIPVSDSVIRDNVESGLSCTSEAAVPGELKFPIKKKLLVLDINGLLADINTDYGYSIYADFKISGKFGFNRPFCTDFLNFCFANFEIGVWSSRKKHNVEKAVQYLMGDLRNKLLFCWDQSKCTATNFNTIDNSHKPLVLKELKKLWEKEEPDLPWEKGQFSPTNTLLVDDSPYKALCNPPFTAIFPPPYSFKHREDNSLGIGGNLRVYLEKLATAEHVQYYVKDNPFGQPAITDSHPNWKYYLRIIENLDKPLVSA